MVATEIAIQTSPTVKASLPPTPEGVDVRLDRIASALTHGDIFQAIVLIDAKGTRPRVSSIVFKGMDEFGRPTDISGASPSNIAHRFHCPDLNTLTPDSSPEQWQSALNGVSDKINTLKDLPVTVKIKGTPNHQDKSTRPVATHQIQPDSISSRGYREALTAVLEQADHPIFVEIVGEKSPTPKAVIRFAGGGRTTEMHPKALAMGLGLGKTDWTSLTETAVALSGCMQDKTHLRIYLKNNGKIVSPYRQLAKSYDDLLGLWDKQKDADKQMAEEPKPRQQDQLVHIHNQQMRTARDGQIHDTWEDRKTAEREALQKDLEDAEPDLDRFDPTKHKEALVTEDDQKSAPPKHDPYEEVMYGIPKNTEATIARWSIRNLDPKGKKVNTYTRDPITREKIKGDKKLAIRRDHQDSKKFQDWNENEERVKFVQDHKLFHQQIRAWNPTGIPSKLTRQIDEWERQIQVAKQKEVNAFLALTRRTAQVKQIEAVEVKVQAQISEALDLSWPRPSPEPGYYKYLSIEKKLEVIRQYRELGTGGTGPTPRSEPTMSLGGSGMTFAVANGSRGLGRTR